MVDDDAARKLSQDIVIGLGDDPDYQKELAKWPTNPQPAVADDAVAAWRMHVHSELTQSLARFMPNEGTKRLMQLLPGYLVEGLPRQSCENLTDMSFIALESGQQQKQVDSLGEPLAKVVLATL